MSSRATAIIRYDGPALENHEMDVHDLAPALLALGDLCGVANEALNGPDSAVRVIVRADMEHRCFQISFDLIQTTYDHLTTFMGKENVKTAKELLEWIGIIGGGTLFVGGGLFGLYKALYKNSQEAETFKSPPTDLSHEIRQGQVEAHMETGNIVYQIVGDDNRITVAPEVHLIARDARSLSSVKKILAPLSKAGVTKLEFEVDGRVTQYFSKTEAQELLRAPDGPVVVRGERDHVSRITTSVGIRKAMFEGNAKWGLMYRKAIEARIADREWLSNYQNGSIMLAPKWRMLVDLEESVPVDEEGQQVGDPTYTVLKVHGIEPPHDQIRMQLSPP